MNGNKATGWTSSTEDTLGSRTISDPSAGTSKLMSIGRTGSDAM